MCVSEIINREAMDSIKGIRFQEIRLLKMILKLIKDNSDIYIIGFPEFWEDLYIMAEHSTKIMEQDKEYSTKFTINSVETRKAFVSFIDIYIEFGMSSDMKFIFHTNTNYTNEATSTMLKELGLTPLDKAVFEYLSNSELTDNIVLYMKEIIIYSYKNIYNNRKSQINKLERMTNNEWKEFLQNISYDFGEPNLENLENEIIKDIEECRYLTPNLVGKEELIKDCLLGIINKRICEKQPLKRAITSSDIELTFRKLSSSPIENRFDPIYQEWENIVLEKDEINDIRNLSEKIYDVCKDFSIKQINPLNRQVTNARYEIDRLNKIQVQGLKTRIFTSIEKYFIENDIGKQVYSAEELKILITTLKLQAVRDLEDLKKDYDYGVKNNIIVENIVMMLIDECFYCFEGDI